MNEALSEIYATSQANLAAAAKHQTILAAGGNAREFLIQAAHQKEDMIVK